MQAYELRIQKIESTDDLKGIISDIGVSAKMTTEEDIYAERGSNGPRLYKPLNTPHNQNA